MVIPAKLCQQCCDGLSTPFSNGKLSDDRRTPHHDSLSAIHDAAKQGCPVCTWLIGRCNWQRPAKENYNDHKEQSISESAGSIVKWREIRGIYGSTPDSEGLKETPDHWYEAQFEVQTRADVSPTELRVWLEPFGEPTPNSDQIFAGNTGAESTLRIARNWLQHCDANHVCYSRPSSYRPTRLIYLSSAPDKPIRARVREAYLDHYPLGVKYATFSHRWLEAEADGQLTHATLDMFRDSIPLDTQKQSLVDALHTVIRLGLSYLWVDSLCILSDDEVERTREIGAMSEIYGRCYCTIAAASAESREAGCFNERDPRSVSKYKINLDMSRVSAMAPQQHYLRLYWADGHAELRECALSKRAWVFQERFLSRRVVHFCNNEIHWECWSLVASETYPEGRPRHFGKADHHHKSVIRPCNNTDPAPTQYEILKVWYKSLEVYTTLSLTFENDRLRALAGISGYFEPLLKDKYLFGHWRKTLPGSLLWSVRGPDSQSRYRLDDVAPRWSWASISGSIHPREPHLFRSCHGTETIASLIKQGGGSRHSESHPALEGAARGTEHTVLERMLLLRGQPWLARMQKPGAYTLLPTKRKIKRQRIVLDCAIDVPVEVVCLPVLCLGLDYGWYRESGLILLRQAEEWFGRPVLARIGIFSLDAQRSITGAPLADELEQLVYLC